nr:hypothetical protein [Tanacetum cinerariifolium]
MIRYLNLPTSLWVIRGGEMVSDSVFKHGFCKLVIAKMSIAITYDSSMGTKSGEERFKEFANSTGVVGGERFRFNLFQQIIDSHENGEGSGTPTEPHHTPSLEAQQTSPTTYSSPTLPPVTTVNIPPVIPTASLPTVTPSDTPHLRQYTRRARIVQSLALPPVADGPASPLRDGSMQQKLDELMALCTSLQRQHSKMVSRFEVQELEINSLKATIKLLEDKDRGVADQSRDDAPIKGRRLDVGEEAAERVSDDIKRWQLVSIPTAGPPATKVPTGSDVVPTAGLIFATTTMVTPYTRRKGNWNKMHKAFPLPVMEFPLSEEVPTASEESSHCQKKRDATAVKIRTATKVKK